MLYYILYPLSLIPLRVGYLLGDLLIFPILFHVVRYRRKMVRKNLKDSFPEKSSEELATIERSYFHFLCDYFVETIHQISMSREEMLKRVKFSGLGMIDSSVAEGHSVAVYLGHYCNWEWMASYPMSLGADNNAECLQIYHPLENKKSDEFFLRIREKFGSKCIKMADTLRYLAKAEQQDKRTLTGFIADQVPIWESIHHWMPFLNHEDTPVITGVEKIAKRLKMDIYYLDCDRPKRGYYTAVLKRIAQMPYDIADFEVTEEYIRMMETTIRRRPELWLWSHNRWKRTKEEYYKRFDKETGRKLKNPQL